MASLGGQDLANAFAEIARELQSEATPKQTWARIVKAAVQTVPGCNHAGISLVHRHGRIDTRAASDDIPPAVDAIQYEVGQGPCLEAIQEHQSYLIFDLMTEHRWPPFSHRAAEETGVRSMLSFRLFVGEDTLGALNLYSRDVDAFDEVGRAIGAILAAHAAVAMSTARDRERAEHLEQALESNREIGMAMGVLMASGLQTRKQAFELLRRASQRLNVKLRDVAAGVVETGELPHPPRSGPPGP
ncbi:MAG: ANTAR domain-containing protein [Pseudonocardiaceae bacterium]